MSWIAANKAAAACYSAVANSAAPAAILVRHAGNVTSRRGASAAQKASLPLPGAARCASTAKPQPPRAAKAAAAPAAAPTRANADKTGAKTAPTAATATVTAAATKTTRAQKTAAAAKPKSVAAEPEAESASPVPAAPATPAAASAVPKSRFAPRTATSAPESSARAAPAPAAAEENAYTAAASQEEALAELRRLRLAARQSTSTPPPDMSAASGDLSDSAASAAAGPSVPSPPIDIRETPAYKKRMREWVSLIVALPIMLVSSYYLFDRFALGNMPTDLQEYREKLAAAAEQAENDINDAASGFQSESAKAAAELDGAETKGSDDGSET